MGLHIYSHTHAAFIQPASCLPSVHTCVTYPQEALAQLWPPFQVDIHPPDTPTGKPPCCSSPLPPADPLPPPPTSPALVLLCQVDEQLYRLQFERADLLKRIDEDQDDLNDLMQKHKDLIAQVVALGREGLAALGGRLYHALIT